ncbi:Cytochrome b2, mitochondrial precursor [Perkinsus chesapeaki]|uniref:Cytochrome b2, mitochondrial n=1 Tax=Perkinsus chesapeaki TaxID=330153 RepID=A0A7J6M8F0_PERCH|nr:Cytochrome b2, mitochondrial precursor [Perkinsus chesapeaki]
MVKVITAAELSKHTTKESCWMAIHGKVYDLTAFIHEHPGGSAILLRHSGRDSTKEFEKFHSEDMIERVLPNSAIVGDFEEPATVTASEPPPVDDTPEMVSLIDEEPKNATLDMMLNAMDFKAVAEGKVSREGWAYLYSAAGDEFSYQENEDAFARISLIPRVLVDVSKVDCSANILGRHCDVPFYITAVAMAKLYDRDGEKCMARGVSKTKACGIDMPYMVPTLASCSLREIVAACEPSLDKWYQLYVNPSFSVVESMITKIIDNGFSALFITVDAPELGMREKDMRFKARESAAVQGGAKRETAGVAQAITSFITHSLSWKNLPDITNLAKKKAAERATDAVRAYRERHRLGLRGIVVSNHGARQVDTVKSGVQMLYECTRALKKFVLGNEVHNLKNRVYEAERTKLALLVSSAKIASFVGWKGRSDAQFSVFVDGGVRRGTDILKCIALGASAVGIGRPFMTAMAAFREDGVVKLANLFKEEILVNMRLLGCQNLDEVDEELLDARAMDYPPPGQVRARY